jgi:hypothetical protein
MARTERIVVAILMAAACVVHARVLGATFIGDDFRHLFESEALPFGRFLLRTNAGHFMAVHNVLFVALHETAHVHALPYYALELLTHLANVALFYKVLRRFGCPIELTAIVVFLWGTAPIHQGTMRWFSVYQAVLATTTTLVALLALGNAVRARRPMRLAELATAAAALWIGAATVGGATAIALCFPAVAWLVLPPAASPTRTALLLAPVALVGFIVPRLIAETTAPVVPTVLPLFGALVSYGTSALIAAPLFTVTQAGVGLLGSLSLDVPITAGAVIGSGIFVMIVLALARGDWQERRLVAGTFILGATQYAAVAVARSFWAYTKSIPWMATRDRYHYSQGLLMALGVAVALRHLRIPSIETKPQRLAAIFSAAALVLLDAATARHANGLSEGAVRDYSASLSITIRDAVRRQPPGADVYIRNDDFSPIAIDVAMGLARWQFPGIGGYWVIDLGTAPFEGHRVRFVEGNVQAVADIRANVLPATAALFVTPAEAERAGATVLALPELSAMRDKWWLAQDEEVRTGVTEGLKAQVRRSLEQDPHAMEDFKRALQKDPAAMEALRREMAKQAQ